MRREEGGIFPEIKVNHKPISFEIIDFKLAVADQLGQVGENGVKSFNDLEKDANFSDKVSKVRNILRFLSRRIYEFLDNNEGPFFKGSMSAEDQELINKLGICKSNLQSAEDNYKTIVSVLEQIIKIERCLEKHENLADVVNEEIADDVALDSLRELYKSGILDDPHNNQEKIYSYLYSKKHAKTF